MFTNAITRKPGKNFADGLTTSNLGEPNYELILKQHQNYINTLKALKIDVIELETLSDFPDCYFVEDTAVVTPKIVIITNPGANSRKGEESTIEQILSKFKITARIQAPGTVDGGDVLMINNHFFIGISDRTNEEGAEQLGNILTNYDYTWDTISVNAGLHLKSSINYVGKNTLLLTQEFDKHPKFSDYQKIILNEEEAYAGNTLLINNHLLTPKGFPKTKKKLENLNINIIEMDVSEIQKMDGGLTCLSLRF